ncbi:unnamed protein product [Cercospora beticola]|nr:unnamed protein product [Cercospora beticola]
MGNSQHREDLFRVMRWPAGHAKILERRLIKLLTVKPIVTHLYAKTKTNSVFSKKSNQDKMRIKHTCAILSLSLSSVFAAPMPNGDVAKPDYQYLVKKGVEDVAKPDYQYLVKKHEEDVAKPDYQYLVKKHEEDVAKPDYQYLVRKGAGEDVAKPDYQYLV